MKRMNPAVCVSVLLLLLVALSESGPVKSCCTQYHETPLPVKVLRSYRIQDRKEYCNIKAVIFKMVKGRFVCADPDSMWVQKAMESMHQKR
ncbi:C-C motif chemokine 20 [Embiotoca jacksoni]|uniref:C-C motif chemokine 20 n=1 Tax=Embiotoca jacksoni TaxID=100190 RepID=UPI0037042F31